MRIISPFKDYYDAIQSYYRDDLKFIREPKFLVQKGNSYSHGLFAPGKHRLYVDTEFIGFCGKVYHVLDVKIGYDKKHSYFYSAESFHKFFKENYEDIYEEYEKNCLHKTVKWYGNRGNPFHLSKKGIDRIFDPKVTAPPKLLLDNLHEPITHYYRNFYNDLQLDINCRLNRLEFFKVFSPQLAYQELYMFFANKASPEKEIPVVSDADLLEAKGFDRFSFRKDKKKNG